MVRSVGVRDAVIGLGMTRGVQQQRRRHAWLAARLASDTADTVAVALAVAQGAGDKRFLGLGLLAAGAAVTGLRLSSVSSKSSVLAP